MSDTSAAQVSWQQYPELRAIEGLRHAFVLRQPAVPVDIDRKTALARLDPGFRQSIAALGYEAADVATAEQVHGVGLAQVDVPPGLDRPVPAVDGLFTVRRGVLLGIYVADCCAVYIADRRGRGIALVHSGRKGSEGGIVALAIQRLAQHSIPAADLRVVLSPCIRPPAYEVDFAARIRSDCAAAGVPAGQIIDSCTCTSSDLDQFYSYRVEKGRTGRMLALMGMV